jgi:hypothetical protein
MADDDFQKTVDFVGRELRESLHDYVGARLDKDNIDGVKAEIQKVIDRLAKDQNIIVGDLEIVGDTIKYKLQQPSIAPLLLPTLKGPFTPWHEHGLVHLAGRLGDYEVRVCDYGKLGAGGYGCSWMLTCLACLTFLPPESNMRTVMCEGMTV